MSRIELYNLDCLPFMKQCSDKQFDLAIVDPPYFDGPQKPGYYKGTKQVCDVGSYKSLEKSWELPGPQYFEELFRISKNQIIWGVNYFDISLPGGRIVWVKGEQGSPFSMADIAYQSFYNRIDLFKHTWSGFWQESGPREQRIHPTQKPVQLYKWLLKTYAKPGDKIIDTHLGSGSIALACEEYGFDLVACEIDQEYFAAASKRLSEYRVQMRLF